MEIESTPPTDGITGRFITSDGAESSITDGFSVSCYSIGEYVSMIGLVSNCFRFGVNFRSVRFGTFSFAFSQFELALVWLIPFQSEATRLNPEQRGKDGKGEREEERKR